MHNFENLSDFDFEMLVSDLLSTEWRQRVDSFPRGRDGGVDLRVLGPAGPPLDMAAGDELVVQCKHRPNASFRELKRELRQEADKPIVNEATRYVLATSARLTRGNKKEVVELFDDRIREGDVYGRNDIDALLRRHPSVEATHTKLWLSSGEVLAKLTHQMEHIRSLNLRRELLQLRATFVETKFFRTAIDCIDQNGICILVGPPGVGKTTTAHLALLHLMARGWAPVVAIADVNELERQLIPDSRQVLLFDDFLGQNSLEAKLKSGNDAELLRLIRAVEVDPQKILVMTTRDYILRRAQQNYEKLADRAFDVARVAVQARKLSLSERTNILYNQLYYSPLRPIAAKANKRRYIDVADHPLFNPRLTSTAISLMAREARLTPSHSRLSLTEGRLADRNGSVKAERIDDIHIDVPSRLLSALANPSDLWDHALRYQLSQIQRTLLLVRATFGQRDVLLEDLYVAARAALSLRGPVPSDMELDEAMTVLDGDCLSLNVSDGRLTAETGPLDPGLADAVISYMGKYADIRRDLERSASFFVQVQWLSKLCGLTGNQSRVANVQREEVLELLALAERLILEDDYASLSGVLLPARNSWHRNIGQRLKVLFALYEHADLAGSSELASKVLDGALAARIHIQPSNSARLYELVRALRSNIPASWRPARTVFEARLLDALSEPDDIPSWRLLKEIADVVPTTEEFMAEHRRDFEYFAEEVLEELQFSLEDEPSGDEADRLQELADLASEWGVSLDTYEVEDLLEQQEEEADLPAVRGRSQLPPREDRDTNRTAAAPESLFDYL